MNVVSKPWKSFEEQLAILKERGLQVDNDAAALNYLERLGYYRLSGYWYSFRQHRITQDAGGKLGYVRLNEFMDQSHFEDAVKLYVFDKKLRLLALDALERIEMSVRVDVAHLLGEKDIYAHENASVFFRDFSTKISPRSGMTAHREWLERYAKLLDRSRRVPFVEHYLDKYGRLPIWVSTEIWDFGLLSRMFGGMYRNDQQAIAAKYGAADGPAFAGWLRGLNFIRNVSAHHSRLWNINVLERAAPIGDDSCWQQLRNERPFFYFCIMQKLMKVICPNSSWGERFSGLMGEFPEIRNGSVSLADFDLIDDWQSWDLWGLK